MERVGVREDSKRNPSWHLEQVMELFNLSIVIVAGDCGNFPSSNEHFFFQYLRVCIIMFVIRDTDVESEPISE